MRAKVRERVVGEIERYRERESERESGRRDSQRYREGE